MGTDIMNGPKEPNFKNRSLFHGDNPEIMRKMDSNCIDPIATDPPFNKGRDFYVDGKKKNGSTPEALVKDKTGGKFQDRWNWKDDVHQERIDKIENDHPKISSYINHVKSDKQDMAAYLCFMAVRLLEMQRILKPILVQFIFIAILQRLII